MGDLDVGAVKIAYLAHTLTIMTELGTEKYKDLLCQSHMKEYRSVKHTRTLRPNLEN